MASISFNELVQKYGGESRSRFFVALVIDEGHTARRQDNPDLSVQNSTLVVKTIRYAGDKLTQGTIELSHRIRCNARVAMALIHLLTKSSDQVYPKLPATNLFADVRQSGIKALISLICAARNETANVAESEQERPKGGRRRDRHNRDQRKWVASTHVLEPSDGEGTEADY